MKKWQQNWNKCEKGRELHQNCSFISDQPDSQLELSRTEFRLITRLQIGHVELNKHLHRIKIKQSPNCEFCHSFKSESVNHYLKQCNAFEQQRKQMKRELREIKKELESNQRQITNINKILSRPQIEENIQILLKFIDESNRFRIKP